MEVGIRGKDFKVVSKSVYKVIKGNILIMYKQIGKLSRENKTTKK